MFIRKKKLNELLKKQNQNFDYTKWESDFGFLTLMINRKVQIAKQFFIIPMSEQVESKDFIHDSDLTKEYIKIVNEIWNSLSENYKKFLITKYFRDEKEVLNFLSETVYSELINSSININKEKISKSLSNMVLNTISKLNKEK